MTNIKLLSTVKYLTNITTGDYVQLCTSTEGSNTDYNIIWSDNSALSHDYSESEDDNGTASTSGDWSNGYLVKNISSFAGESWSR